MGAAVWFFLRTPDGRFASLPSARFQRFWNREAALPAEAGSEAVVVELAVDLEGRQPVQLLRTVWSRFRLDRHGRWEEEHAASAMKDYTQYASARLKDPFAEAAPPIDTLLEEIRVHASRFWEPSASDLDGLCDAVNRRAKRLFLTHDGKTLLSVGAP